MFKTFYEIKDATDGDYTEGLIVCPPCSRKATAEGFRVTANVVSPSVCQSCGLANVEASASAREFGIEYRRKARRAS